MGQPRKKRQTDEVSVKAEAIRKTSGCLTGEEGEDFAHAVAEAGEWATLAIPCTKSSPKTFS